MRTAIHWFRRDLRVTDNSALARAVAENDQVVPVYVLSGWKNSHHWTGYPRQSFLCECLQELDASLRKKGGRLLIRSGPPTEVLLHLAREVHATAIYANRDPDPYGRSVETKVLHQCEHLGIRLHLEKDHALHERDEILTGSRTPFRVFTPYARAWSKLKKPAAGPEIRRLCTPSEPASLPLPTPATWGLSGSAAVLPGGESAARNRLANFLDRSIHSYGQRRDLPGEQGTSRLSQDLRHGTLSIREVYAAASAAQLAAKSQAAQRSISTFLNELIWREFYFQVLWHHPDVLEHEYQPGYRALGWRARWRPEDDGAWRQDPVARRDFDRWRHGQTGFPIVDAGMRELLATGFMHNRVRMITAMFLTKDLRIWWMHGEAHFMQHLVDGEIASNNGGWQWSASTGTDAAPYFRIQNPWTQAKRFDPEGEYIRRWIPELRDVPRTRLHIEPPTGRSIAVNYPAPMVNHAEGRELALKLFTS